MGIKHPCIKECVSAIYPEPLRSQISAGIRICVGGCCCYCCCFLYLNSLKPNGQNCPVTRKRMMSVIITMYQNISGQNATDYIKGGFAQHLYIKGSTRTRRGRSRRKKAINARDVFVHQKQRERDPRER